MVNVILGDILDVTDGVIIHQVNCQGVMNSGVAKQLRSAYPIIFNEYKKFVDSKTNKDDCLGVAHKVQINDNLIIYNVFGQFMYGYDKKQYTSYDALKKAFEQIANEVPTDINISLPYNIGCCRGGGDWNIVVDLIINIFDKHRVTIYRFNGENDD